MTCEGDDRRDRIPEQRGGTVVTDVRVRFCPSPTGNPHVGNTIRTAPVHLAYARAPPAAPSSSASVPTRPDSEQSHLTCLDAMRWLGLTGRGARSRVRTAPLAVAAAGAVRRRRRPTAGSRVRLPPCYCTSAELAQRREAALAAGRTPGWLTVSAVSSLLTSGPHSRPRAGLRPALPDARH